MSTSPMTVLVVGATGSIGRLVVEEAVKKRHVVRALVRDSNSARRLLSGAELVVGDLTRPDTLTAAVAGVNAIVFTHGSSGTRTEMEQVDYGAVRNVLTALDGRSARIALMTAIGVTNRDGEYNRRTESADWKRRGERLVRVSGLPYTIVRPGWFDYNKPDEHRLVLLQGDRRHAGNPSDGVISRRQLAEVLVSSLTSDEAQRKTFELVATKGPAQNDLSLLFSALEPDPPGALDAILDLENMPLSEEPQRVRHDLDAARRDRAGNNDAVGFDNPRSTR
jgi:uncharacterized protein YbjT (DUF2867 family)